MTKVKVLSNHYGNNGMMMVGDVVELSDSMASELIKAGLVKELKAEKVKDAEPENEKKSDVKPVAKVKK